MMLAALATTHPNMVTTAGYRPGVTADIYDNTVAPDATVAAVTGPQSPAIFPHARQPVRGFSLGMPRLVMTFKRWLPQGPRQNIARPAGGRSKVAAEPTKVGKAATYVPVSEPAPFYEGFGYRR